MNFTLLSVLHFQLPRSITNHLLQHLHPLCPICRGHPQNFSCSIPPSSHSSVSSANTWGTPSLETHWPSRPGNHTGHLRHFESLSSLSFPFPQSHPLPCSNRSPPGAWIPPLPAFPGDCQDLPGRSGFSTLHRTSELSSCSFSPSQFLCVSNQ